MIDLDTSSRRTPWPVDRAVPDPLRALRLFTGRSSHARPDR